MIKMNRDALKKLERQVQEAAEDAVRAVERRAKGKSVDDIERDLDRELRARGIEPRDTRATAQEIFDASN